LIVQSFKSFVVKIALEDYGHIALLRLIDVTDDTVLVRKALYSVSLLSKVLFCGVSGLNTFIYFSHVVLLKRS